MHCCTYPKWVYLKCTFFSSSEFNSRCSSHSWFCARCYNSVCPTSAQSTNIVSSPKPTFYSSFLCSYFIKHLHSSICSSLLDSRIDSFSLAVFLRFRNLFILGNFNCYIPSRTPPRHPLFFIIPLEVAPLLKHSSLPPPLSFCAPGRSFKTWVLMTSQFFNELPLIYKNRIGIPLLLAVIRPVLLQEDTLFPLLLCSLPLWH